MIFSGPTLYEDWQKRRDHLGASIAPAGHIHREARVRVLNRLLACYRGAPEAAAPARFPFRPGLSLTHRAAVVHHYLGGRAALNVQMPPAIRAAVILGRIAGVHPQSPAAPAAGGAAGWLLAQVEARSVYWCSGYWQDQLLTRIGEAIRATFGQRYVYLTILERLQLGPKVPDWAIMYMFERLDNPASAADAAAGLFVCCENECVLDYAVLAWRDRLAANGPDSITRGLQEVFFRPHWRAAAVAKIRAELASHNAATRLEALRLIAEMGDLEDIGLLMDLLALPPMHDEEPSERDALLYVAEKLAGLESGTVGGTFLSRHVVGVGEEPASGPLLGTPRKPARPATLYEDWLLRRRRLTHLTHAQQQYVAGHRNVLDSLLERCRGSPQADCPARFAAPPHPLAQREALLTYHQLGRAEARGALTETEAGKRAATILRRIRNLDPQSSARDFAAAGVVRAGEGVAVARPQQAATPAQLQLWADLGAQLDIRGLKPHVNLIYKLIGSALELGPELPERAVYYLIQHLDNPDAVELLERCGNPSVLEYVFGAWRQRVLRQRKGPLRLLVFFLSPRWREQAAEKFRRELAAADNARVRVQAVRALGRLGSLEDTGLLSDLLFLPAWKNEDPRERPALLHAMRRLGRQHSAAEAAAGAQAHPA